MAQTDWRVMAPEQVHNSTVRRCDKTVRILSQNRNNLSKQLLLYWKAMTGCDALEIERCGANCVKNIGQKSFTWSERVGIIHGATAQVLLASQRIHADLGTPATPPNMYHLAPGAYEEPVYTSSLYHIERRRRFRSVSSVTSTSGGTSW